MLREQRGNSIPGVGYDLNGFKAEQLNYKNKER